MIGKQYLLEELKGISINGYDLDSVYFKLNDIAAEIGAYDLIDEFIDYEKLEKIIKYRLKHYGVLSVKEFIWGIKKFSSIIYYLDGYGDARNVTKNDLKFLKLNLINKLED